MRTLIFGAKGQLGKDLLTVFDREGEVAGHDLPEVNVADEVALQPLVKAFAPTVIINAAAYTDVDGAEDNLEAAFLANEVGARNVAEIAAYFDVPVVYFSTDYVFDGKKGAPYTPDDPIAPVGVYGKTKAAGEAAVRKASPRHYIVRTAWLYGPGGNNFIEKILRAAAQKPALKVVADEVGSPTHTWDLAEATLALVKRRAFGTCHAANTGACSRFELAQAAFALAEVTTPLEPCSSSEFPSKVARPTYSVLDSSKLEQVTGHAMRPWRKALQHYMERRLSPS